MGKAYPLIFHLGLFLLLALFSGTSHAVDKTAVPVYRVAIDQEYAPYEFLDLDGAVKGFIPELLREIGKTGDVAFSFIPMDWPEAVAALEKGRIDLISMIRTPQRLGLYEFSAPHSQIKQAIFRHISTTGISALESLAGHRVALQRNDISLEMLAGRNDFQRFPVQGKAEGFLLLNAGKVDAFLAADQAGLHLLREYALTNVEPARVGLFPQDFCFTARKGNRALIQLLDAGLQQLKNSGRYAEVFDQWLAVGAFESSWLEQHGHEITWFVGALATLLAGVVAWNLLLRRTVELRTRDLRASRDSLNEAQRIARLGNWELNLLNNRLTWSDEIYRIFEIDPQIFGSSYEAFLNAIHPEDREMVNRTYTASVKEKTPYDIVHRLQMPDGRIKYVSEKCETYYSEDGKPLRSVGTAHDITARKLDEIALQRLNREMHALSSCNQALMRTMDEKELLEDICRIVCEEAGYRMAWVGYPENDEAKTIRPLAWAGILEDYLESAQITWADTERGRGPAGTAIRSGESVWIQDFSTDPQAAPWRDAALARGYYSSIALPLKDESANTFGILNIYSAVPNAFTPKETRLLEELATDMAFGIINLRTRIERKQATEEIGRLNERFSLATRAAHLGVWDWDMQKNELIWDERMYALYGVKPEDFSGAYATWLQGVHPEDRAPSDKISQQAQRGEREYDTEFRVVWPDGSIHWLKAHAQFVRDAGGKPLRMTGVNYDITEHKQAEEKIRQSELKYRTLIQKIQAAVVVHGADTQILISNPMAQEILGLTEEQMSGKMAIDPAWHFYREDGTTMPLNEYPVNRVRASRQPLRDLILRVHRPNRENDVWALVNADPVFGRDGELVQIIVTFIDISGRKQVELALQASEQRYRMAQAIGHVGNWEYNIQTTSFWGSDEAKRMYGFDPAQSDFSTEEVERCIPERARVHQALVDLLENAKPYNLEFAIHPRNASEPRIIASIADVHRDEQGNPQLVMGVLHDITERKRAEEEIRKLNQRLEQRVAERTAQLQAANRELEAFCYSVSHDLRAPLRHIDGYIELLVSRCRDALNDKGLHYIDTIAAAARQMGVLIDDLLHFSRTGRAELQREKIDMNRVLQEALASLQSSNAERSIEWVIGELPQVRGDFALLRQVWANLLGNAIKYTRPKEVARIEVGSRAEDGEIIFCVADNGVGFDMQYAAKLFGVFQRLHPQDQFEGTGIGLATVQRIVNRHGGRIWAEAEPELGARFYFSLPKTKEGPHD